jgi:hypothetical protein
MTLTNLLAITGVKADLLVLRVNLEKSVREFPQRWSATAIGGSRHVISER